MTNELMSKIADNIVEALIERLANDNRFVTAVADVASKVTRPIELSDEVVALIDKHIKTDVEKLVEDKVAEKVEDAVSGLEFDVDNVTGLEKAIESALDDYEVEATNVDGLDRAIGEYLSENSDDVRVDAGNVENLDDAIIEAIAKSKELQRELQQAVLSGLTIVVDAKVDGKSIEGVTVDAAH